MEEIEEDFLTVDDKVPGQNYVCLSFISPESVVKKKETFLIHNFLKSVCDEYKLSEKDLSSKYEDYVYKNEKELNDQFNEENDFVTSVRGVKIRGVYESKREADVRAKVLQRRDKNHNVFVGQIGYWLPWDPALSYLDDIDSEYLDKDLNTLMKKYQENQENKNIHYQEMVQEKISTETKKNLTEKDDPWMQKITEESNVESNTNDNVITEECDESKVDVKEETEEVKKEVKDEVKTE